MRHDERGFTLVELMMALVIFSVAVAGILSVAVSLTNGFREQRLAVGAQDAVRAPIDLIADALRQASPGVSDVNAVFDVSNAGCTRTAVKVTPGSTTAPDVLDVVYASGGVVTSIAAVTTAAIPGTAGVYTLAHADVLAAGDFVLITSTFGNGYVFEVSAATGTSLTLVAGLNSGTCATYPAYSFGVGDTVIRVQHATFYVADDPDNNNMTTLWMDPDAGGTDLPEPLAEGIEDLQVALGVDTASDGISDINNATAGADDWVYNVAGESVVVSATTPVIRAVRVTLVARTTKPEQGNTGTYNRPAVEDRTAGAADTYRRRVLKTIVEIRNGTGSP